MNVPLSVDLSSLTLDNFQSLTNHRFRMTKDQKARAISREEALAEYVVAETTARANSNAPANAPTNS